MLSVNQDLIPHHLVHLHGGRALADRAADGIRLVSMGTVLVAVHTRAAAARLAPCQRIELVELFRTGAGVATGTWTPSTVPLASAFLSSLPFFCLQLLPVARLLLIIFRTLFLVVLRFFPIFFFGFLAWVVVLLVPLNSGGRVDTERPAKGIEEIICPGEALLRLRLVHGWVVMRVVVVKKLPGTAHGSLGGGGL